MQSLFGVQLTLFCNITIFCTETHIHSSIPVLLNWLKLAKTRQYFITKIKMKQFGEKHKNPNKLNLMFHYFIKPFNNTFNKIFIISEIRKTDSVNNCTLHYSVWFMKWFSKKKLSSVYKNVDYIQKTQYLHIILNK